MCGWDRWWSYFIVNLFSIVSNVRLGSVVPWSCFYFFDSVECAIGISDAVDLLICPISLYIMIYIQCFSCIMIKTKHILLAKIYSNILVKLCSNTCLALQRKLDCVVVIYA